MAPSFNFTHLKQDYGDRESEARACRNAAALFDFSFMSAARITGTDALKAIAGLTDRHLDNLTPGRIRYALCHLPGGWLRSDLTVWNEGEGRYLVMSGLGQDLLDLAIMVQRDGLACSVEILGDDIAVYSVQGPDSLSAFDGLTDTTRLAALPYFGFTRLDIAGIDCLVGRLGYTGERGFEIVLPAGDADRLWQALAARARPAGFAAADCLRIEAGFVLFANEFRLPVTAAEAGLEAFAGGDIAPPRFRLVCFRAESHETPILWHPPEDVVAPEPGTITVTSACHSTAADGILGLGYVQAGEVEIDNPFVDPTGRFENVQTVPMPFYDMEKRRPRGAWS
ncbi:MAG: aminomethyltransferase family protein [Proteobacteria bacterium]|nr:aminomethyltransferase family protein [Pseudomonadota bacterium]MDA1024312.1 aminomethyltransferase family protein [Pseudomonadota bacterium]